MSFFDKITGKDKKGGGDKKPAIKNPFANVGKAMQGNRTFQGQGNSLGGTKPGKLIHVELANPGSLGMKVSLSTHSFVEFLLVVAHPLFALLYMPTFSCSSSKD